MTRRPPITTRTYTLLPSTTLFRPPRHGQERVARCADQPAEGAEHHKSQQRRLERAVQREQVQLAAQRVFGGIGAGGGARQGRSWRRRGVEYRGREEGGPDQQDRSGIRSEEHTSELQSLMRISYAVFCLKKKRHRR